MQRWILRACGFAVDVFYRRRTLGAEVPDRGPVLLVGNHPNGLVDPVLLAGATRRPVRFLGKAPLFEMPGVGQILRGLRALPVYRSVDGDDTGRNEATFEAVYGALAAGDVVCLFPEGVSHSEPGLKSLKTGAARMALGAERRAGFALGVRVVPVGLVYRARRRFRSEVAVWIGAAIGARDLAQAYAADERGAVRALTERISAGLMEVTLGLDRWEDLPLLELAERIDAADGERLERLRAFAEGVRELRRRAPARVDDLARRIAAFRELLRRLDLEVEDLDLVYRPRTILAFVARGLVLLLLALPLGLLGIVLWFPPYRFVPWLVARLAPAREIHATTQILAGAVFFPLWALGLALATGIWLGWPYGLALALAAPGLGLAALGFLEWHRERRRDVATFLRLGLRRRLKAHLQRERDGLAAEIEALRAERGRPAGEAAPAR